MQLQDNESTCIHCGKRIAMYRGSWFGPGDEVQCTTDALLAGRRHKPDAPPWIRQARAAGWRPLEEQAAGDVTIPKYDDVKDGLDLDDMLTALRLAADILEKHRDGGQQVPAHALRSEADAWEHEVMDEWDRVEAMNDAAEEPSAC